MVEHNPKTLLEYLKSVGGTDGVRVPDPVTKGVSTIRVREKGGDDEFEIDTGTGKYPISQEGVVNDLLMKGMIESGPF